MNTCEQGFAPLRQQARAAINSPDPDDNAVAIAALEDYLADLSTAPCTAQRKEARVLIIRLAAGLGFKETSAAFAFAPTAAPTPNPPKRPATAKPKPPKTGKKRAKKPR
jgi:hypothetical protein